MLEESAKAATSMRKRASAAASDASVTGIEAVLEQNGHVIAYTSRVLSSAECNYSVIQIECLAVV